MTYIFAKYFHILGILVLFAMLVVQHRLLKPRMTITELSTLARVDALYGVSAGIVLVAGLCLWFVFGKGYAFYSSNPIFHAKIGLFVLVALMSIYPTIFFIKNRKLAMNEIAIPRSIVMVVRIELLLLTLIPLLGIAMAQGYGLRH